VKKQKSLCAKTGISFDDCGLRKQTNYCISHDIVLNNILIPSYQWRR
jgi:hypothetical protein